MTSKASLRETLSIAHTAECKLHMAANRPERDLRFLLGHALTLDSVTLRLVEIERESATVQQPSHASGVKFQAAGTGSTTRRRSPPPSRFSEMRASDEDDEDEDEDESGNFSSEDDQEELALMRFPSGTSRPREEPPPLVPSDDSSSDEEDPPSPKLPSDDILRGITKGKGNEDLMHMYASVKGCPCHGHHQDAPKLGRIWELPTKAGEERADGIRLAVAEVAA
ncbi:hypothetical protein BU23DRAFT_602459 [Bimuria novae-zelandiae CBS 107.79]|uniref:Uncharacterized protein n=1 Tax=Bimuria novae-zelandiae CBS 107.79 TaxID=1447943 RepID=A0A6A5US34_9PLEO|nr:hypothetical protein BU23DRAFT_602459 [Bimuria novae-zelandiae CBS 107.79]